WRKGNQLAQRLANPVSVFGRLEVPTQPRRTDRLLDRRRVVAATGMLEGTAVDVRRKDLDLKPTLGHRLVLLQQHREAIGFFAGRAARNPEPQSRPLLPGRGERRYHIGRQ